MVTKVKKNGNKSDTGSSRPVFLVTITTKTFEHYNYKL